jgi:hypothetical protein
MNRADNKTEMDIINKMDVGFHDPQLMWIKKIFTEKAPEKTREIDKIMDGLILCVHERNCVIKRKRKKWDEEDIRKLEFLDGEINAMCYCLGHDTRL